MRRLRFYVLTALLPAALSGWSNATSGIDTAGGQVNESTASTSVGVSQLTTRPDDVETTFRNPEIEFFNSNGVKIAFIDVGDGEPVIFLHGFAIDLDITTGIRANFLKAGYRFIAIDARGHGRSGKPHDGKVYGAEMADDVARLLDHLKISQAHVVGYSMGGAIANKVRERHPDRLLTVTLGGVGKDVTNWGLPQFTVGQLADSLRAGKGVTPVLCAAFGDKLTPKQIEQMNTDVMKDQDPLALAAVLDAYSDLNVSEQSLKKNAVPALVLVGENAGERPPAEEMAKIMNKATLVIVQDADHAKTPEQPQFLQAILRFLSSKQ